MSMRWQRGAETSSRFTAPNACTEILLAAGVTDVTVIDSRGIVHADRADLTEVKAALAAARHAAVVATGRSDYPNQINNVLAFPGVFRGALDSGARCITEAMKLAAAAAIAEVLGDELDRQHIVPSALDARVAPAVAAAVAAAAIAEGVPGTHR